MKANQPQIIKRLNDGWKNGTEFLRPYNKQAIRVIQSILRIDFPGYGKDEGLEHISWEDFFQKFDESQLAFLYQDEVKGGEQSRFFKFVKR